MLVNSYSLSQVSRIRVGPKWVTKVNKSRVDGKSKDLGVWVFWVIGDRNRCILPNEPLKLDANPIEKSRIKITGHFGPEASHLPS